MWSRTFRIAHIIFITTTFTTKRLITDCWDSTQPLTAALEASPGLLTLGALLGRLLLIVVLPFFPAIIILLLPSHQPSRPSPQMVVVMTSLPIVSDDDDEEGVVMMNDEQNLTIHYY